MDDYFYPYPAAGVDIPDDKSFAKYNNGMTDRGDWRRYNVNELIRQLHDTIRTVKPWVFTTTRGAAETFPVRTQTDWRTTKTCTPMCFTG